MLAVDIEPQPHTWELHQEPHRHYKVAGGKLKKPTWNGAGKKRIVSVTTMLGGDTDSLTGWAARQALAAGEWVVNHMLDGSEDLMASLLSFGQMAELSGIMPDDVRDDKAESGNAAHEYLYQRLVGQEFVYTGDAPYGLRVAIEDYLAEYQPEPVAAEQAVGSYELALAGTFDALVYHTTADGSHILPKLHMLDLKQSNSIQPKMWSQLACYHHLNLVCGGQPADFLSILHIDALGNGTVYSIAVGSKEHAAADADWRAALVRHHSAPILAAVTK